MQDGKGEGISHDNWEELVDAENPHKLMYSLQIVESLSRPPKFRRNSYDVSTPMLCIGPSLKVGLSASCVKNGP